jgi:hypothetical protein
MLHAIKQHAIVQAGGRIEVFVPELAAGVQTEVIVLETSPVSSQRTLVSLIGQGKGAFANPQELDNFIRAERDAWE